MTSVSSSPTDEADHADTADADTAAGIDWSKGDATDEITAPQPLIAGTDRFRLVIITGLSGAGRSTAAHALEDVGWYVVDNLPPSLLPQTCQLAQLGQLWHLAVVLDVRTRLFFEQLPAMFTQLHDVGVQPEICYLEASDEVIVRRQESARRPHPLQGNGRLMDGIVAERAMLAQLRASADMVVDTSSLNVHQLTGRVSHAFGGEDDTQPRITVVSFGFKHGVPIDADMVFDVRFLPNPHWIPRLRQFTGLDAQVSDYVLSQPGTVTFLDQLQDMVAVVGAGYLAEGKRFATIGIGCTGGQHRSIAIAEEFARRQRTAGIVVNILHRDLGRE
jgi:UPF0042 nucleotide-binding protein